MTALLYLVLSTALVQQPATDGGGLTPLQRSDLATAQDNGEFREQAFYALVEHVRTWQPHHSPAETGEAIRLAPDLKGLIERPAEFRGELCRISGELLQRTALGPPYEDVSEWFIREDRTGLPVIVYIVDEVPNASANRGATTKPQPSIADRQHIQVDARFYKRMRFAGRDQQVRDYAAFVGAHPTALATPASRPASTAPAIMPSRGLDLLGVLVGPVLLLALVFAGLRLWIARRNRAVETRHTLQPRWMPTPNKVDEGEDLPDDPAEALAELRRRAQARESTDERG